MAKFKHLVYGTEYTVEPVKLKTKYMGTFNTIMTQLVQPDPALLPEDPYYTCVLDTPCRMPESDREFTDMFDSAVDWYVAEDLKFVDGTFEVE